MSLGATVLVAGATPGAAAVRRLDTPSPSSLAGLIPTLASLDPKNHHAPGGTGGGSAASSTGPAAPSPQTAPGPASSAPPGQAVAPANAGTVTQAPGAPSTGCTTLSEGSITWTCTFDSEFSGTTLDTSKWAPVLTATSGYNSGHSACFVDSPNNISVGNGYLSLTARKEAKPFTCKEHGGGFRTQYTSGTVATLHHFSQAYGRFEVKAKVPAATVAGLQSSFWLFPVTPVYGHWPASGEIDIAEIFSNHAGYAVPHLHYMYQTGTVNPATNTNIVTNPNCAIDPDAFNDYVVEWTPATITITYNGTTCLIDNWVPQGPEHHPSPFDQPFFVNLTQALGMGPNAFNPKKTPLPATTEIQFVRIWQIQS